MNQEKDQKNKEMTIREATIYSLEMSEAEFNSLKETFQQISELFDSAKDIEALNQIKSEIIPKVTSFYNFCLTLTTQFDLVIPEGLNEELRDKIFKMEKLCNSIDQETDAQNFVEVGDILRFDFYDLINECSQLFPKLIDCFTNAHNEELDQY